ncbi:hypothetical protein U1Q18_020836 [Sarracenia purpurea var. burkii]
MGRGSPPAEARIQINVHPRRGDTQNPTAAYPVKSSPPPPPPRRMYEPFKKHFPWLVPTFVVINISLFVIVMYINNCPQHSENCIGADIIGRFAFQSRKENPLLGPSGPTLEMMGALEAKKVVDEHQVWRLITCTWLHAGVFHVLANMFAALLTLVLIIAINLAVGILPHVDNFAHIGGFVTGFFLGFVFLIRPQFAWVKQRNSPPGYAGNSSKPKYKIYQHVLLVISIIVLIAGFMETGFRLWCRLGCLPSALLISMAAEVEFRCFVEGLAWATDDRSLERAFSQYGNVIESKIINDLETGISRGFGFVTFKDEQSMKDAIEGMNGQDLDGRNITINEA